MTALMISCMMGNWDLIQMLVEDFGADLDGPISRGGFRAIDFAAAEGFRFPNEHPIVEYLKSKGSQHTWWGALAAGDFKRVKEYVDNGQDVNEVNPVLWNGNSIHVAHEYGQTRIAQWLLTQGAAIIMRNNSNVDNIEMKWSVGRHDCFYYKAQRMEKPGVGVTKNFWVPEFKA
jgi:ankyrin repeat protein